MTKLTNQQARELLHAGHPATQIGHREGKRFVWRNVWTFPCGGTVGQFTISVLRRRLGLTIQREGGIMVARLKRGDT